MRRIHPSGTKGLLASLAVQSGQHLSFLVRPTSAPGATLNCGGRPSVAGTLHFPRWSGASKALTPVETYLVSPSSWPTADDLIESYTSECRQGLKSPVNKHLCCS